ncbi:dehydratase [bacterium]|nr:MAG: dehydratase [bacterium]
MTSQAQSTHDPLAIGTVITFSKTVGESDVYQFAGVSGDFSPNHVNHEYMSKGRYGQRIAHGALMVAYMSTCSTKLIESAGNTPMVSYGYDHIRFTKPVFFGDTVTVEYKIAERDDAKGTLRSQITVTNQRSEVVAVAVHILKAV